MNTYGSIGNETAGYYVRTLLAHAEPVLVLERFAVGKTLPRNETKTILFRRSKPFQPATIPLVEGVAPNGSDFGYDTVQATIQQYGDWAGITDHVTDTSKDNVLRDMGERQGEQIGETRELLTWYIVRAGTNVSYAGASSRSAITKANLLTATQQRRQMTELKRQKAKKFTRILSASPNYETYAIQASYVAVCHSDHDPTIMDLKSDQISVDHFVPTSKYGSSMGSLSPQEIGNFEEVRYVTSPDLPAHAAAGGNAASSADGTAYRTSAKTGATDGAYDVYPILFLGRDSFGTVVLRGVADKSGKRMKSMPPVEPKVVNVDTPGPGDPLGQKGSIGWKMWFAALILNDMWLRRLEVACTA